MTGIWMIGLMSCILYISPDFVSSEPTCLDLCPGHPNCKCCKNADLFDIFCKDLTDLNSVRELLQGKFQDKRMNMVLLKSCSATHMPDTTFYNLSIATIVSYCPFRDMDLDSLSTVRSLENLKMRNCTFERLPRAIGRLSEVINVRLDNGKMREIKDELHNMTSLAVLSISRNKVERIDRDAFVNNKNLRSLRLSANKLKFLHRNIFDPLILLLTVSLNQNHLSSAKSLFKKTRYLKSINIKTNELNNLENVFYPGMIVLNLNLQHNNFSFINASAFSGKLTSLNDLKLNNCGLKKLDPNLLRSLKFLDSVDLSANKITSIPEGFFHDLRYLKEVQLNRNKIHSLENVFYNNPFLATIGAYDNKIEKIGNAFQNIGSLRHIYLQYNKIKHVTESELGPSLVNLEILSLKQNKIGSLDRKCFSNLKSLQHLDLGGCGLESLNGSIRGLESLKSLKLYSNRLTTLSADEFTSLNRLSSIDLSGNCLVVVNGAFSQLSSLTWMKISENKLTTISSDTFAEDATITKLWLKKGNKWICDCRLLWLQQMLQKNVNILKDEPFCRHPPRHRYKLLRNLTREDLTSWPDDCPNSCSCSCVPKVRSFFIRANCSQKNLAAIPVNFPQHLEELSFRNCQLKDTIPLNGTIYKHLRILDLENNDIAKLQFDFPDNLTTLKLARNNLTRFLWPLPDTKRQWQQLTLSGNPWICDCEAKNFREWILAEGKVISDVNETRCGYQEGKDNLNGKVIAQLSEVDLCPTIIETYIIITVSALSALLSLSLLLITYSRYKLYAKVWLYSRGFSWVKEDELDSDKKFDAYVSYNKTEEDVVWRILVKELEEKQPSYSLCIPERNVLAGNMVEIAVQVQAITLSKRTIVLLTENYLSDLICKEEFDVALASSLEDKVHRIILIVCGKLPLDSSMDPSMRALLKSPNCLRFGEKLLWEKLRFALPKKT